MFWSSAGLLIGASMATTGMPLDIRSVIVGIKASGSVGEMTQPCGLVARSASMIGRSSLISQLCEPFQFRSTLRSLAACLAPHSTPV